MNDGDSTVGYVFQFQEGSIYKMGDLEVRGLDSKATDRMVAAWRLLRGRDLRFRLSPGSSWTPSAANSPRDQWKITVHETPEDQDKTVDVSLHFDPEGSAGTELHKSSSADRRPSG